MNIYSPKPIGAYRDRHGTLSQMLTDSTEAWNLIWLSLPKVDDLLNPDVDIHEFLEGLNTGAAGSLRALAIFRSDDEGEPISSFMGPSPVKFVQDLQDHFDLSRTVCWNVLGGQAWIDTMMARAFESEGKSDIFQAAKQSANVIIADFGRKRNV